MFVATMNWLKAHNSNHLANHQGHWQIKMRRWVQVSPCRLSYIQFPIGSPCLIEASHMEIQEISLLSLMETLRRVHLIMYQTSLYYMHPFGVLTICVLDILWYTVGQQICPHGCAFSLYWFSYISNSYFIWLINPYHSEFPLAPGQQLDDCPRAKK